MSIKNAANLLASVQIAGGAAVGGIESNLWAAPEIPHAADDEFDGSDMSGWAVQNLADAVAGTISYDTVDSYDASFTSGNVVRVNLGERKSWALYQVPSVTKVFAFYKSVTLPTNLLMVARFKHLLPYSQGGSNGEAGVFFAQATGGVPTTGNRLAMILNASVSGSNRSLAIAWNSGGTPFGTTIGDSLADGMPFFPEYVAIHKIGTSFHFWVGSGQGAWVHFTIMSSVGFTPDMVGFHGHNSATGGAGVPVVGIDFIRFYETANFFL